MIRTHGLQEFNVWEHEQSGDTKIRTLSYSLSERVFDHIDLVQPTTMFARMKNQRTSFRWSAHQDIEPSSNGKEIRLSNGVMVDASCNSTVTISCLKQLYNAVGVDGSLNNSIAVTGYLQQFANKRDLQLFYADQRPDAVNSSFSFISVHGQKPLPFLRLHG